MIALLILGAVAAGCGTTAGTAAAPSSPSTPSTSSAPASSSAPAPSTGIAAGWVEPPDYHFSVESSCGERAFSGSYRVDVRGGHVAAAEELDPDGHRWVRVGPRGLAVVLTLGDMVEEARRAATRDADQLEVRTDPDDGHPTEVRIDPDRDAVDEESCYVVTDYVVTD